MDEHRTDPHVTTAPDTVVELRRFLADQSSMDGVYGILCGYVKNAHIVAPEKVEEEASELLQSVVLKALELADKYHGMGVRPWLLRIASNMVMQKRSQIQRHQRVMPVSKARPQTDPGLSDDEWFDIFTARIAEEIAQIADLREDLKEALACLSSEDQHILNCYLHHGFDHNEIARILHIRPGAARTRYHRAVSRLRDAWTVQSKNRGGESDA
jgi:RNA polymerase sigma factor (sigma-70 family)